MKFAIEEQTGRTAVVTIGRFNPITIGHEKLVDKVTSVAKRYTNAAPLVYLTHSEDRKKNPLPYSDKIRFAKQAFGNIVQKSRARNIIEVLQELEKRYDNAIVVVGSDRVKEFDRLVNKYNGKDYTFDETEVISAGERDPDAEGVTGISASKMRQFARQGNYTAFKKGLPKKLRGNGKHVYDAVRSGMGVQEMTDLTEILSIQQRRKRRLAMRRVKARIQRGRRIARRRFAKPDKLRQRAQRKARRMIRKRVAGARGGKYQDLSPAARMQVDKQVHRRQKLVKSLSKRMLPKVRKAERERLKSHRSRKEEYALIDQFINDVEIRRISEKVSKNLEKKAAKNGVNIDALKEAYVRLTAVLNEDQAFDAINTELANSRNGKTNGS